MTKIKSVEDALNYAIAREVEAHRFYTRLAASVQKAKMRRIIEGFAEEELEHKAKLEAVKAGHIAIEDEEIGSLGITDKLPEVKPQANMSYTEMYRNARKLERNQVEAIRRGTVLDWMYESRELAKTVYGSAKEGDKLGYRYSYDYLGTVMDQLQKAGIRLARVLNDIYG